jgi:hypothetical protein
MASDFFISCEKKDIPWAEWIDWNLESFGYTSIILLKDFDEDTPDYYKKMHDALNDSKVFVAVYSWQYAHSDRWPAEWHTAYVKDPLGEKGLFIPVRIEAVQKEGLLLPFESVDIFGMSEEQARNKLRNSMLKVFKGAVTETVPPHTKPPFPGVFKSIEDKPEEDAPLNEEEAVALLAKKSKTAADGAALELIKALGLSSKNVNNAARYIYENSITIAEALDIVRENGAEVFSTMEEN